jgi:hypothetical protein
VPPGRPRGTYDTVTALFTAPSGREKYLVATDHLESERLRGLIAVSDRPQQAEQVFRRAERVLVDEAEPPPEPPLPAV